MTVRTASAETAGASSGAAWTGGGGVALGPVDNLASVDAIRLTSSLARGILVGRNVGEAARKAGLADRDCKRRSALGIIGIDDQLDVGAQPA